MAVCLTLMMGRLGSVVGANMVAILIETHCKLTFSMAGIILICTYYAYYYNLILFIMCLFGNRRLCYKITHWKFLYLLSINCLPFSCHQFVPSLRFSFQTLWKALKNRNKKSNSSRETLWAVKFNINNVYFHKKNFARIQTVIVQ